MLLPIIHRLQQNSIFFEDRIDVIDAIILEMRSGKGFRGALQSAARQNTARNLRLLRWLKDFNVAIENGRDPWRLEQKGPLHFMARELAAIDRNSHKSLSRLLIWRNNLRQELYFRRRSGQILLQIRLQAALAVLIYGGILAFSWNSVISGKHFGLTFASLALFAAGLAVIFTCGRRIRWNF